MGSIYTRKGDRGETSLFGGTRIQKSDLRVECYGTVDEANSTVGFAYSLSESKEIRDLLRHLQKRLFTLGAELASDPKGISLLGDRISEQDITFLEETIDQYQEILEPQRSFVIPGGTAASAALHVARTVVRRTERKLVRLAGREPEYQIILKFVNRLSDVLFILARAEEQYYLEKEVTKKVLEKLKEEQGGNPITLKVAKRLAEAAEEKALEMGVPIVFSVVDAGGNLLLLHRMDLSLLASVDISINKAFTALSLKMPTHQLTPLLQPGAALYGIQNTNNHRIVAFGGGYPLERGGIIIGGIGVSGGSVEQDMEIAIHVVHALQI